ncbi:MAG: folylpolyglutamate synthase/dihydrofolate synthase family protein [Alphaproteobacteria bacterium]
MSNAHSDLILQRLQRLHPKAIDLSLDRLLRLLDALDHPERRLAPVVHVAGTNGKGSTLAMLDAMLAADGRRVQRYISPHLVRFNERILFDGEPIDEQVFSEVLDRAERANRGEPITFFEITTAAAFLAFAEREADVLLLETGLGGRLDATNVVERPLLTLITPVSYDHQAFLGDRLDQIAGEKAGILKAGVPCALGPQQADALDAIRARAESVGAPLILHGRDWEAERVGGRLEVRHGETTLDLPLPALKGAHQILNAGLAVVAALSLGDLAPSEDAIAAGLTRARWPARLQALTTGPLPAHLPDGSSLWLDGGHNPAAGEVLAAYFDEEDPRPLHLVVGMINTKDSLGFLAPLAPLAASLQAVPVPDEQASRDPAEVVEEAEDLGLPATVRRDVPSALLAIAARSAGPVRVLICGSLYLAGHVLRANS